MAQWPRRLAGAYEPKRILLHHKLTYTSTDCGTVYRRIEELSEIGQDNTHVRDQSRDRNGSDGRSQDTKSSFQKFRRLRILETLNEWRLDNIDTFGTRRDGSYDETDMEEPMDRSAMSYRRADGTQRQRRVPPLGP
jgi:hypothetical protein